MRDRLGLDPAPRPDQTTWGQSPPQSPGLVAPAPSAGLDAPIDEAAQEDPVVQVALLRVDQCRRWRRGERILTEAYLERYTALRSDPAAVVDLIYNEVLLREAAGESLTPEEYIYRFPHYAAPLQHQFAQHQLARWAGAGDAGFLTTPEAVDPQAPTRSHVAQATPLNEASQPAKPAAPVQVPGYEILGELGRGGMGIVYKARHTGLKRVVALKMLLDTEQAGPSELARFRTEAEALARLQHPNIVQVYDVGEHAGKPFFSLEFCAGGSLNKKLARTPVPGRDAASMIETLARAIHAAHQQKVIHRDLKPANVLLAVTSGGRKPPEEPGSSGGLRPPLAGLLLKITDFGLAKKLDDTGQTHSGAIMGTPSYMAPEQARGETRDIGPAADIYALGAILYECLTGRPPFRGARLMDTLRLVTDTEPVPPSRLNPACPRDLETICLKCLQKRIAQRYASAELLADDLRRWLDGRPILARPAGRGERLVKWARRSPWQAASAAVSVLFLVAFVAALAGLLLAARKDAALLRQEAAEQTRVEDVRIRATQGYARAEKLANAATPGWEAVRREARGVLDLVEAEPALAEFPLLEPTRDLLERADRELADARLREEHRDRLVRLKAHHGDAVFFGTLGSGLELSDSVERTRRAVAAGLALFGVRLDNDGPPAVEPRFFTPAENRLITALCYELLLLDADVLALQQAGETVGAWRGRLREALARVDRADRLQPGVPTHSSLARRAVYLSGLGDQEQAQTVRQAADETAPVLAADHFLIGLEHHRREQFKEALKPLASVLRLQPGHYGAEYLLAACLLREGRWQEAKLRLTSCLEQRREFAWPRLLRGFAEMKLGDAAAARADYDAVLTDRHDPMAAHVALVNRGALGMEQQRWDEAIADLELAITRKPDAVAAHLNLALAYRQRGELPAWQVQALLFSPAGAFAVAAVETRQRQARQQAVAVLDEAVRRRPQVARLYHERGRLHLQLEDLPRAREDFAKAVLLAPGAGGTSTLADDLIELGRLMQRNREHAEAVAAYQTVLQVRPEQALAWRLMAEPLLALGRYPEAGEALDRYLATIPASAPGRAPSPEQARRLADAFKARGLIHVQRKDFRAALESYSQGLKLGRDPDLLALRGWACLTFDAPALAVLDFDESLQLRPGDADALLGRADARVKLGKVREALADADEAVTRGPATERVLYTAARVHAQAVPKLTEAGGARAAGRSEERAVQLLRRALVQTPLSERAAFWRDYVQTDSALNPIRRGPAMRELAATFGGGR